jgi:hypothetical protein
MAQAVKPIAKTLDDAARFLTEERGYEKNSPEICWAIWEQLSIRRIKLERHWKKYLDREGNTWIDASEVVSLSHLRSIYPLEFDRRGYLRFVDAWGGYRYTIVEPCDFQAIWPLPASQPAPEDKANPDSHTPTSEWVLNEAVRMKREGEIPEGISETDFAKLLAPNMHQAAKTDTSLRPVKWQHIRNNLRSWGAWPISSIKISDLT